MRLSCSSMGWMAIECCAGAGGGGVGVGSGPGWRGREYLCRHLSLHILFDSNVFSVLFLLHFILTI